MDEIDIRKCYVDVDRKFKGQHGIILTLQQWNKLKKAIKFIDRKIEIAQKKLLGR